MSPVSEERAEPAAVAPPGSAERRPALSGSRPGDAALDVSVVIPVGREVGDLENLHAALTAELTRLGHTHEVLFIADGVGGEILGTLTRLAARQPEVVLIRFRQTFGESVALSAGFERARGRWLLTFAPYLQVVPSAVVQVLDALAAGNDFVSAWRHPRVDPWLNRLQSGAFNWVTRTITGVPIHDLNCGLRAMTREVAATLTFHGDLFRFLPILATKQGFKVAEVQVGHLAEMGKRGFFGFGVSIRRFLDILTLFFLVKFTRKPLRFFGLIGAALFVLGVAINAYLVVRKLGGESLADRPLLLFGTLLLVLGFQTLSIGLLGEIIIYLHARKIREYVIDEEL
ncbi:MAG: glycosyltransferase [Planctomycetes bacterium]|nr:glycosyltransferase [Planctomycetota bacterium]